MKTLIALSLVLSLTPAWADHSPRQNSINRKLELIQHLQIAEGMLRNAMQPSPHAREQFKIAADQVAGALFQLEQRSKVQGIVASAEELEAIQAMKDVRALYRPSCLQTTARSQAVSSECAREFSDKIRQAQMKLSSH